MHPAVNAFFLSQTQTRHSTNSSTGPVPDYPEARRVLHFWRIFCTAANNSCQSRDDFWSRTTNTLINPFLQCQFSAGTITTNQSLSSLWMHCCGGTNCNIIQNFLFSCPPPPPAPLAPPHPPPLDDGHLEFEAGLGIVHYQGISTPAPSNTTLQTDPPLWLLIHCNATFWWYWTSVLYSLPLHCKLHVKCLSRVWIVYQCIVLKWNYVV